MAISTPTAVQIRAKRPARGAIRNGLEKVRQSNGDVLSGGERRRTNCTGTGNGPEFILLDEPFAGVDPIAVEDIQRIVENLRCAASASSSSTTMCGAITDRAYLLFEGRILKHGTAEELASDEQVRRVYLGQFCAAPALLTEHAGHFRSHEFC